MENTLVKEPALATVLKEVGWHRDDAVVSPDESFQSLSASTCRFFTAHHRHIPGAGVVLFVTDGEGNLRARTGDMDGLAQVLRACLPQDASAQLWADLVASFSQMRPPTVIEPQNKLGQAGIPAGQYHPPQKREESDQTQIEFFAIAHDLRRVHIKAVLPASGPVRIEMLPLN
ncbi:MAG: hypothetical protein Q4G71_01300 [Pseudomonadota bacterium]|nr:hypothetical protein [Pseudomonadota bacterium]